MRRHVFEKVGVNISTPGTLTGGAMKYDVHLEVAGPLAMFARPDTGGTPTSYPVPTWSACKGVFESIAMLKSGDAWICPTMVEVCRPKGATGGTVQLPGLYLAGGIYAFHPFKAGTDFASFPSEHAAVATAMATAFSILIPAYRPTFFFLAIIISMSRLVIGLNYPGDILAGMILGMITVVWLNAMFDRFAIELRADKRRLR
jgi:CRISPR-associated Cas5-like protein